jgi:hypothetical protein
VRAVEDLTRMDLDTSAADDVAVPKLAIPTMIECIRQVAERHDLIGRVKASFDANGIQNSGNAYRRERAPSRRYLHCGLWTQYPSCVSAPWTASKASCLWPL